jgi:hypothetical protein
VDDIQAWNGCVISRVPAPLHLSDTMPTTRYKGPHNMWCGTEILPLTQNKAAAIASIDSLVADGETYIPAGLIWGLNALSPSMPLTEGAPYDPLNADPKKVLVLMTDGANTRSLDQTTGYHWGGKDQKTDQDTVAICNTIKSNKIEIFTVAFQVTDTPTLNMLRDCASSSAHAFDARDSTAFMSAFKAIGSAITAVRLSK